MTAPRKRQATPGWIVLLGAALCPPWTTLASADQIIVDGVNYPGARVLSLEEGQLQFRSAEGTLRKAWLNDVDMIWIDRGGRFADFNQAERFLADGHPQRAAVRYRRAQRSAEEFWLDLIAVRLLLAHDASGQLDKAVGDFIRVLRGRWTGPIAAAHLIPKGFPAKRDSRVERAIEQLETAIRRNTEPTQRVLLALAHYEVSRRYGDGTVEVEARRILGLRIPEPIRSEPVYAILLEALRSSLEKGVDQEALTAMDRAVRNCPRRLLPDVLLLKGRTLLSAAASRDDLIRAAWSLLRVPIHFPDDPKAAAGLYHASVAVERLGRPDKAMELLEECLAHARLDEKMQPLADAARKRLETAAKSGG